MEAFRHKTKKQSFQGPYYAATAANIGGMALLSRTSQGKQIVAELSRHAPFLRSMQRAAPGSNASAQTLRQNRPMQNGKKQTGGKGMNSRG